MANGGVRDLLVRLGLDNMSEFKSQMASARDEVKKLESSFRAVSSDKEMVGGSEILAKNLQDQIKVLDGQIEKYKTRIGELKTALSNTGAGSREEKSLLGDITKLETAMNNTVTHVNKVKDELNKLVDEPTIDRAERFVAEMSKLSLVATDIESAYSILIGDWAKETANLADLTNVGREQALAYVEKIAKDRPGWYDGWAEMTDEFIQQLIEEVPLSYEEVATIMANAMQAGGVAVEDIQEFTKMFAKLEKSTTLNVEEGVTRFGRFLTLMDADVTQYEALASVIVDLGNNVAASESEIVEVASRSASALRAVGISAEDILGLAAATQALNMEPAAAASALEKLAKKSGASAEFAAKGYSDLKARLREVGAEYASFYDLQVAMDTDASVRKGLLDALGMTNKDFTYLVNQAVQAEKVAGLMGQTVEEFSAAWASDPAKYFTSLFETIGKLDESGGSSIFETLASLGITEIRESRLASNFALVSESMNATLELARTANDEAVALEKEAKTLFETTESQRQMNKNKSENFLQAMGEGVTSIRQPWEDFWADLKQNMTENMPDWALAGMGAVVQALSGLGDVLSGVTKITQGLYYSGQVYKNMKDVDWKGAKGAFGAIAKGAVKAVPYLGAFAGFATMAGLINDMYVETTGISEALANVQINIDEESKNRALSALAEVKAAADSLNNQQLDEKYAGTSVVVQRGFGTEAMFGQALGYEQEKANREIESVYSEYGNLIKELEQQLLSAASDADARIIQQQIEATETAMNEQIALVKGQYTQTLSALYEGAVRAFGSEMAAGQLALYGKQHDLLMQLYEAQKMNRQDADEYLKSVGAYSMLSGWGVEVMRQGMTKLPEELIKDLYERMSMTVTDFVTENGPLMGIISTMLENGAMDNALLSDMEGFLLSTMQALDLKAVAENGAGNWKSIGEQYMGGMAMGIEAGKGRVLDAAKKVMNEMVSAAKGVLDIHSPSRVGRRIGVFWDAGIAGGVLDGSKEIESAMKQTMTRLRQEAETLSPRVNAVMAAAAGSGGAAGYAGSGGGQRAAVQSVTNNYSIAGADIYTQQGVRKLAQQIARVQKNTNGSIGKG